MGQVAVGVTAAAGAAGAVLNVIERAQQIFKKKPERPPSPPPKEFNISQDDLIRDARIKLNMDVINNYNYALCGPRGTGKSKFINCIRELKDNDEGAAPIGMIETTNEIKSYKFPPNRSKLQHAVFWDIPGSGTVKHPLESYFNDKVLYAFDCLLITCDPKRFGEEEIKIIKKAQQYKTPVVLLITKLEEAVDAEVKAQFNEEQQYQTCGICSYGATACCKIFVNCTRFCTPGRHQPTLDEYRDIVEKTIINLKSYAQQQQDILPESRIFVISTQKYRDYCKSVAAGESANAKKDLLLSGEMDKLIDYLCGEASRRRN